MRLSVGQNEVSKISNESSMLSGRAFELWKLNIDGWILNTQSKSDIINYHCTKEKKYVR